MIQYLENFGNRSKDPLAMHLMGLTGNGKSALVDELTKLGLPVEIIDSQTVSGNRINTVFTEINEKYQNKPYVLLIDELDKSPEIGQESAVNLNSSFFGRESTVPLIGALNQILSDGALGTRKAGATNFSNVFVMTTMNFSPMDLENFIKDVLHENKSFYELTITDFEKFDNWLTGNTSATHLLLSHLFRPNTVGRLAPNTVFFKPLQTADYEGITRLNIQLAIEQSTLGASAGKRITVENLTDNFVNFIAPLATFAPSGARETVYRVNALTEQLVSIGSKATFPGDQSLDRPRKLRFDYDGQSVVVHITPFVWTVNRLKEDTSFEVRVQFDPKARLFTVPDEVSNTPPNYKKPPRKNREKPITKKEVLAIRFPSQGSAAMGLAADLDTEILGQGGATRIMEKAMRNYMNRQGSAARHPDFDVFAGFPGIGKSQLIESTAARLNLPLVKLNMQQYTSGTKDSIAEFFSLLSEQITAAERKSPSGKYIILFEEVDKVAELNPKGEIIDRPIMSVLKDIFNDGESRTYYSHPDLRSAYVAVTMNFGIDRFGFVADPRITTIEDTLRAYRELSNSPAAMKRILSTMFLPETISRILPHLHVMKPLEANDYYDLIKLQVANIVNDRFANRKTGQNKSLVEIELTKRYSNYLFADSVIPSEGARHTVENVRNRISTDLELALQNFPRSSPLATKPIIIIFDFLPGKSVVKVTVRPQESSERSQAQVIYNRKVELTFPDPRIRGPVPPARLSTSIEQFGHAFYASEIGLRFENIFVQAGPNGSDGGIKYRRSDENGTLAIASLYALLAGRAMQRIILAPDPRIAEANLSLQPDQDLVAGSTKILFQILHEWGYDQHAGLLDRNASLKGNSYASFGPLSSHEVEAMSSILRNMESFLIDQFLRQHPITWYREKVVRLAQQGIMTEEIFYQAVEVPFPGENEVFLGERLNLHAAFGRNVQAVPKAAATSMAFKRGQLKLSPPENMAEFRSFFLSTVRTAAHPGLKIRGETASVGFIENSCAKELSGDKVRE